MTDNIGWVPIQENFTIKQGAAGAKRFTVVATKADGTALDTYDGWTSELVLVRNQSSKAAIVLDPTVMGDAANKSFYADVEFVTETTATQRVGNLTGDLVLIDPQGRRNYAANITLTITRSYAPEAE